MLTFDRDRMLQGTDRTYHSTHLWPDHCVHSGWEQSGSLEGLKLLFGWRSSRNRARRVVGPTSANEQTQSNIYIFLQQDNTKLQSRILVIYIKYFTSYLCMIIIPGMTTWFLKIVLVVRNRAYIRFLVVSTTEWYVFNLFTLLRFLRFQSLLVSDRAALCFLGGVLDWVGEFKLYHSLRLSFFLVRKVKIHVKAVIVGMDNPSAGEIFQRRHHIEESLNLRIMIEPRTTNETIGWRVAASSSFWLAGGLLGSGSSIIARVETKIALTPMGPNHPISVII